MDRSKIRGYFSHMYRRLKADRIFDGQKWQEGKILLMNEEKVEALIDDDGTEAEAYRGILSPGFINSHCHLELSHMKGRVLPGKGMVDFLISVVYARRRSDEGKMNSIRDAEAELWEKGVNGVADICNTADTIEIKKQSRLQWHSLVEVINFYDSNLENQLQGFRQVREDFEKQGLHAVLTPHAPYSVSPATYDAINDSTSEQVISMHNQESEAENELFLTGKSDFLKLYAEFGDGHLPFPVTGKTSLHSWLPHFTNGQTIVLVHNTFITGEDIDFAMDHAKKHELQLVFCLCPNANLYIEGVLPPVVLLMKKNCRIVVGTDSYSSNYELSIAAELKTLKDNFPALPLETLLTWSTSNGADAMGWKHLGRFEKGSEPGVILVDENNFTVQRLL